MNSDFSDFIRFFPIFRLFPTFRLLDSTTLVKTEEILVVEWYINLATFETKCAIAAEVLPDNRRESRCTATATFPHETLLFTFATLCTESCCQMLLFGSKKVISTFSNETLLITFDTLPFRLAAHTFQTQTRTSPKIVCLWRRRFCTQSLTRTLSGHFSLDPSWNLGRAEG